MAMTRHDDTDSDGTPGTGTIRDAAWKTQFMDDIDDATDHPRCNVENSTTQSLTSGTFTALTFDTEDSDPNNMHSTASNTSRITIPSGKGGVYLLVAYTSFAANATGVRSGYFKKNGTTILGPQTNYANGGAGDGVAVHTSFIVALVPTDYVEFFAYQNSGGALNAGSATEELRSRFMAHRLTK
jgi:hypothetical protein